jgi:hypothetical protein
LSFTKIRHQEWDKDWEIWVFPAGRIAYHASQQDERNVAAGGYAGAFIE